MGVRGANCWKEIYSRDEADRIRERRQVAFGFPVTRSTNSSESSQDNGVETGEQYCGDCGDKSEKGTEKRGTSSPVENLFGLALSGGGIRSALFNDGFLQALSHRGLLRYVDYLSSVSGGGYIAGHLIASGMRKKRSNDRQERV